MVYTLIWWVLVSVVFTSIWSAMVGDDIIRVVITAFSSFDVVKLTVLS